MKLRGLGIPRPLEVLTWAMMDVGMMGWQSSKLRSLDVVVVAGFARVDEFGVGREFD
jgi:hypothetical protein